MRHLALTALLPVVLGGGIARASTAESPPPRLGAKLVACATGPTAPDRAAQFTGSMPTSPGTRQMAMRFTLLERRARTGRFHPVAVPKLGTWERSRPDSRLPGFIITKRVDGLAAPGAYRAAVSFRWYDAAGRVIRRARRRTGVCLQPDPRPDLVVARLRLVRGPQAGQVRYVVDLRNRGRGDAAVPFATVLTVDGIEQPPETLATLGAGARGTVSFVAPDCSPGSSVRVVVDAGRTIREISEANNALVRRCPSGAAQPAATLAGR
jgi:CARDB protein